MFVILLTSSVYAVQPTAPKPAITIAVNAQLALLDLSHYVLIFADGSFWTFKEEELARFDKAWLWSIDAYPPHYIVMETGDSAYPYKFVITDSGEEFVLEKMPSSDAGTLMFFGNEGYLLETTNGLEFFLSSVNAETLIGPSESWWRLNDPSSWQETENWQAGDFIFAVLVVLKSENANTPVGYLLWHFNTRDEAATALFEGWPKDSATWAHPFERTNKSFALFEAFAKKIANRLPGAFGS